MLVISSPENLNNIEEIQKKHLSLLIPQCNGININIINAYLKYFLAILIGIKYIIMGINITIKWIKSNIIPNNFNIFNLLKFKKLNLKIN